MGCKWVAVAAGLAMATTLGSDTPASAVHPGRLRLGARFARPQPPSTRAQPLFARRQPPQSARSIAALPTRRPADPPAGRAGGDWPNFRGPHHDGISPETGLLRSFPPEGPKVLWRRDLPGGFSSVSVAGGRLFTPTKENKEELVLCLDALTGDEIWTFRYPCDYDAHKTLDARFKSGPRATPAVDGDVVYSIGTTGLLYCLEAATGKEIWRRDILELGERTCPDYGYCNSPFIVGDVLFLHPGGRNGNSLAALNKHDGSVLWKSLDDRIGWATPVLIDVEGTPQLVYFTGEAAVGVNPGDGRLLWRYPWTTAFDLNVATPIYADGKLFISSNYAVGGALLKLRPEGDPDVIWKSKVLQCHFNTCVLYDGYLYGFSTDRLRCVEFDTGKLMWDKPGLGRGSLLLADGQLIILSEGGQLVLADATPAGYTENARWQALEGTCWNVPVLAGGVAYLRNERQMVAVELAGESASPRVGE